MKVKYIIRIDDNYCKFQENIMASDLFTIRQMFKCIKFILNIVGFFKEVWDKTPGSNKIHNWLRWQQYKFRERDDEDLVRYLRNNWEEITQ